MRLVQAVQRQTGSERGGEASVIGNSLIRGQLYHEYMLLCQRSLLFTLPFFFGLVSAHSDPPRARAFH